jgi:hypothetical protein
MFVLNVFRRLHAEYITVAPGRTIRVLVFKSKYERKAARNGNSLRPLHLSIHGGGFMVVDSWVVSPNHARLSVTLWRVKLVPL